MRPAAWLRCCGRSLATAVNRLDGDFYHQHCREIVLSRALVETAVQDLERNQGKTFPQLAAFRRASGKVGAADTVGAVAALTDYLHDHEEPVGVPGTRVTLVDTSYKGTVQELLSEIYPATRFAGRYAFFAESSRDPHPGTKRGYALHLRHPHSNDGLPVPSLPDDVALTFTHDDALGAIEETLHGPFGSPRRFTSGLVSQDSLRFRPDPLDGLNRIASHRGFAIHWFAKASCT